MENPIEAAAVLEAVKEAHRSTIQYNDLYVKGRRDNRQRNECLRMFTRAILANLQQFATDEIPSVGEVSRSWEADHE